MWIEAFKSGVHTDRSGKTIEFSAGKLDEIARLYNSRRETDSSSEAPLVKGHPATDSPAFGWVEKLARRGTKLLAKIKNISPALAEEIKKGAFRRVSVAFYPDYSLRHIGLLGGAAPAVKGLAPVEFAAGAYNEIDCEGAEFVEPDSESGENDAPAKDDERVERIARLDEENRKLREKIESFKSEIEDLRKRARLDEFRRFAESLSIAEGGSLKPTQTGELTNILELAYNLQTGEGVMEFAEGESTTEKIMSFARSLGGGFSVEEYAKPQKLSGVAKEAFDSRKVSPERLHLHEKARQLQDFVPGMTYEDAVDAALKEFIY